MPSQIPPDPSGTTPAGQSVAASSVPAQPPAFRASASLRLILLVMVGGVAATVSSILIDRVHGDTAFFLVPKEVTDRFPPMGQPIPQEVLDLNNRAMEVLDYKNTALSLGIAGLALCGLFGLAAGLGRKSATAGMAGLLGGAVAGAGFGICAGFLEVFVDLQLRQFETLNDTLKAIIMHVSAWLVVGVGAGLVFGFVNRATHRTGRLIAAAVSGGLVAGVLYAPLAALFFAADKSEQLVPTGRGNKIFWIALAATLMALAMHRAAADRHSQPDAIPANKI